MIWIVMLQKLVATHLKVWLTTMALRHLRPALLSIKAESLDGDIHGLVNKQKAIENGHRNSGFTHEKWWFSMKRAIYSGFTH